MITTIYPTDEMSSRERLLAAYRGEEVDRLPYWVKAGGPAWLRRQSPEVRKLSHRERLDYIGADGTFGCPTGVRVIHPEVTVERSTAGNVERRITRTPEGDLNELWTHDPDTQTCHPTEFPIKTIEDVGRWLWRYEDVRFEADEEQIAQARAQRDEVGDRGILVAGWGTSPLMDIVQHIIGPINTNYFLVDHPRRMEELIGVMHDFCLRLLTHVAKYSAADVLVSVENTSTTIISPGQFETYCYGHLCDYGRIIEAAGKMHELHMCGKTLVLLQKIDTIPASSIEAFTAPQLGNTRLVDGGRLAPGKTLVGGTQVNTWLMPAAEIKHYIAGELQACPDHRRIVLTTAGVAPPTCTAETFREVGEWLARVPLKL